MVSSMKAGTTVLTTVSLAPEMCLVHVSYVSVGGREEGRKDRSPPPVLFQVDPQLLCSVLSTYKM